MILIRREIMLMWAFQCIIHPSQAHNPSFPHIHGVLFVDPTVLKGKTPPSVPDSPLPRPEGFLSQGQPAISLSPLPLSIRKGQNVVQARSTSLSQGRHLPGSVTCQSHRFFKKQLAGS